MKLAAAAFAVFALPITGGRAATKSPTIRAQADGVHLNLRVSDERGITLFVDGEQVRGDIVMALRPGGVPVKCSNGSDGSMESSFEAVAEDEGPSGY